MTDDTIKTVTARQGQSNASLFRQKIRKAKKRTAMRKTQRRKKQRRPRTKIKLKMKTKRKMHGKGKKTIKRVRWKDRETGSSLVSYSNGKERGTNHDSPLLRDVKPLKLGHTRKKRKGRKQTHKREDTDSNIIIIHGKGSADKDVLKDAIVINSSVGEARTILKEAGVRPNSNTPEDLLKNLAVLTDGIEIQAQG